MIEPSLALLASTYKICKKICKKCFATNSLKSKKCRKRKCGHHAKLRMKNKEYKKKRK